MVVLGCLPEGAGCGHPVVIEVQSVIPKVWGSLYLEAANDGVLCSLSLRAWQGSMRRAINKDDQACRSEGKPPKLLAPIHNLDC